MYRCTIDCPFYMHPGKGGCMKEYQLRILDYVGYEEIKPKKAKKVLKNTEQVPFHLNDLFMPPEFTKIEKFEMEEKENE